MDMVDIANLREKAPYELSGGQQQRVAIACVLAMQPEVMVLDEPTSFLDPKSAVNLFEVLKDLNEKLGLTIVLVEHRLDLLSTYVKRIVVMEEGRVRSDGTPRDILSTDETRSIGIGLPKVIRLYQELTESGIELGKPPISVDELVREIRGALKR
jgi:energy-coupling factor transporter ATP-binding protein EcfA2